MRTVLYVLLVLLFSISSEHHTFAQDSTIELLKQQIEVLELKLKLAEAAADKLQQECDALRKENLALKSAGKVEPEKMVEPASTRDQFEPGVVWIGTSKSGSKKGRTRWALSVSKRDGENFEGGVAVVNSRGTKFEFAVSGKAPRNGDGLVVVESALMGRAKLFMRGTLRNGAIAFAFSGTNPLGGKLFGSASLKQQN